MTVEEMNHKMLYRVLSNQLVILEDCKRGHELGTAFNDRDIEMRKIDTIKLLQSVERSN